MSPGFAGLVAVPLAPHTLHSRAIVTASNDVVEMDLSHNADTREATLFVDGELLEFERPVRRVYVRRGDAPTVLLRYHAGRLLRARGASVLLGARSPAGMRVCRAFLLQVMPKIG